MEDRHTQIYNGAELLRGESIGGDHEEYKPQKVTLGCTGVFVYGCVGMSVCCAVVVGVKELLRLVTR